MAVFVVELNNEDGSKGPYRACRVGKAVTRDIYSAFPFKSREEARFFSIGSAPTFNVVKLSKVNEKKLLRERALLAKEDD